MTNWEKTNQFYVNAGVPVEKSREQIAYEKWLRKVTDRNGNFRVSKEDGLERPVKIVNSIIRIREDTDTSEGYIVSKQTHIGLNPFMDPIPKSVNHQESYLKPNFRYQHRQTRNRDEDEVDDIVNLPTGQGKPQTIYTVPFNEEGRKYIDSLMKIASPRITFYVCQTGRAVTAIPVRTVEDLKSKKFVELLSSKYWTDYDVDTVPSTMQITTTGKKKVTTEVVV